MNSKSSLKNIGLLVALFALACVPAFAGHHHVVRTMASVMTPSGTPIPAGTYHVNWQSHRPTVTVTFMQDEKVVATVDGRWEDRGAIFDGDSLVYRKSDDGMLTLSEICFAGRSQALVIGK